MFLFALRALCFVCLFAGRAERQEGEDRGVTAQANTRHSFSKRRVSMTTGGCGRRRSLLLLLSRPLASKAQRRRLARRRPPRDKTQQQQHARDTQRTRLCARACEQRMRAVLCATLALACTYGGGLHATLLSHNRYCCFNQHRQNNTLFVCSGHGTTPSGFAFCFAHFCFAHLLAVKGGNKNNNKQQQQQ